ncbi:hypothetical protein [Micromonospora sp. NPDC023737]|uniref:hypothetical protein n=1 Tax=unclassified Micromonospora TaxID=2617518 RepID=UPI003406CA31
MTTDEESDDIAPVTWTPVGDLPGHLPIDRLDYGDAEQLAEMTDTGEPVIEEPLEMVDAPIKVRAPYDGTLKRRNQRPLPT